jgi:hypothetical protein
MKVTIQSRESHEAYSDEESQASRAEDEQVVVASC